MSLERLTLEGGFQNTKGFVLCVRQLRLYPDDYRRSTKGFP